MLSLLFIGAAGLMFGIAAVVAGNMFSRPVREPVRIRRNRDLD